MIGVRRFGDPGLDSGRRELLLGIAQLGVPLDHKDFSNRYECVSKMRICRTDSKVLH